MGLMALWLLGFLIAPKVIWGASAFGVGVAAVDVFLIISLFNGDVPIR